MKSLVSTDFQVFLRGRNIGVALVCSGVGIAIWYGWVLSPLYHDMCALAQQNKLLEQRIKTMRKTTKWKTGEENSLHSAASRPPVASTLSGGLSSWMKLLHRHNVTLISCKQVGTELFDQLRVCRFALELYGTFTDLADFLTQKTVRCQECSMSKQQAGVLLVGFFTTSVQEKGS
jgi:hypothetical protein